MTLTHPVCCLQNEIKEGGRFSFKTINRGGDSYSATLQIKVGGVGGPGGRVRTQFELAQPLNFLPFLVFFVNAHRNSLGFSC